MADSKITALAALTAADPVNDMFPVVDVSDTSMAASGTTKRISANNILSSSPTASGALTVTGLVTAGSATVTGDLTVDTSTLKVDSTNNRVGIGTATPSNQLHVKSTSSTPALIETSGGALAYLQFTSTTGSAYIGNNANGLGFYTTGSADLRMSLSAAGDLSITSGNVVMATSGKGIDFSATASGSGTMTSELLNDYEEGTWVGTLTGGTTNPTTTQQATGRYTKIGRVVTVQISFSNVNTLGAVGTIGVTGLPFACNNSSSSSNGSVSFYSIATFTGSPFVSIGVNESFLNFFSNISNAAFGNVTHNAGAAGNYLTASITYTV